MLTESQIIAKYGRPNPTGDGYLFSIQIPFDLKIAWNLSQRTRTIRCHRLVADRMKAAFEDLFRSYGQQEIERLHLNVWGGCFMYRKMRNGSATSRHSWGIAFDIDPLRNGLRTGRAQATLDNPEYDRARAIFKKHGFFSLGERTGFDWMHFETDI